MLFCLFLALFSRVPDRMPAALPSLPQTQADFQPSGSNKLHCWWAGMFPRVNQSPQSISITTKKRSAQGSLVPLHQGRKGIKQTQCPPKLVFLFLSLFPIVKIVIRFFCTFFFAFFFRIYYTLDALPLSCSNQMSDAGLEEVWPLLCQLVAPHHIL